MSEGNPAPNDALPVVEWVVPALLARGKRPDYPAGKWDPVSAAEVERWSAAVRSEGVKSILCLLDEDQLRFYRDVLPSGLLDHYRACGFHVEHVPAPDHRSPPLSPDDFGKVWEAFVRAPKPVLVHCSAGVDRTGLAVEHILARWGSTMTEENELALVRDFPELFADYRGDPRVTCTAFGCAIGDGWEPILRRLCEVADHERKQPGNERLRLTQVKEKFGLLRVYWTCESGRLSNATAMAEQQSSLVCEHCGSSGRLRDGGGIKTLCDACDQRRP